MLRILRDSVQQLTFVRFGQIRKHGVDASITGIRVGECGRRGIAPHVGAPRKPPAADLAAANIVRQQALNVARNANPRRRVVLALCGRIRV